MPPPYAGLVRVHFELQVPCRRLLHKLMGTANEQMLSQAQTPMLCPPGFGVCTVTGSQTPLAGPDDQGGTRDFPIPDTGRQHVNWVPLVPVEAR